MSQQLEGSAKHVNSCAVYPAFESLQTYVDGQEEPDKLIFEHRNGIAQRSAFRRSLDWGLSMVLCALSKGCWNLTCPIDRALLTRRPLMKG